ncbi:class I SAM-dependent methyltransferase [Dictyobacter kobayashii]|uniref:Methyltransferase domain-containing protein n=1 Tax=Dictyobacter kobayashii TaxID=2014872 RepID=A0A402AC80_9CHLR|nr:class I SAM-dependent methyltransferase [Dictyobacter kobayashii]GCE16712.1 hypothetical protein KDK_05120 [Dictyobacter kobayashii]
MSFFVGQIPVEEWERRAAQEDLYAVFSKRWSPTDCQRVNQEQQAKIVQLLSPLENKDVLDVGCGIGRIAGPLSGLTRHVTAIDISEGMLQKARQTYQQPNLKFIQSSVDQMPFNDQVFDAVIAIFVLQHIIDESSFQTSLKNITRVLKPGAKF